MAKIYAVHFLTEDGKHHLGNNWQGKDANPWKVGETRKVVGTLRLCFNGYHYADTWEKAFLGSFIYGPTACIVQVDDSGPRDLKKGASRSRKLVEMYTIPHAEYQSWKTQSNQSWTGSSTKKKKQAKDFSKYMEKLTGWHDVKGTGA